MRSTISSKGQITVPVEIRASLGLRPGTPVSFELRPEGALLRKGRTQGRTHPVDEVFGSVDLAGAKVDALVTAMRGPGAATASKPRRRKVGA